MRVNGMGEEIGDPDPPKQPDILPKGNLCVDLVDTCNTIRLMVPDNDLANRIVCVLINKAKRRE